MAKFLFVLTRGPEDPTRAVRCFQFAKIAADKGHEVTVFLVDDAVYLTNLSLSERIKAPTGDELWITGNSWWTRAPACWCASPAPKRACPRMTCLRA